MKHHSKVRAVLLIILIMTTALGACSSKNEGDSAAPNDADKEKPVVLKISLGSNTPSEDQVVSPQNPNVLTSTQIIAEEYMKRNKNVIIEWDRSISYKSVEEWSQYLTTLISSGRAPDIVFGWNGDTLYKNWYLDLTEELNQPNPYIEGNKKWKDTMPEYVFTEITDANGRIMGVPVTVFPGPPTAYFYNKSIFDELNLTPPKSWEDLKNVVKAATDAGYIGFGTNRDANIRQLGNNWDMQFTLGPAYGAMMKQELDYDGDGEFSNAEVTRAIYENKFSVSDNPAWQDFWKNIRIKYIEILPEGYQSIDFKTLWDKGQLAIFEEGLWALPTELSNTQRNFDFGMVPPVVITPESSEYVGQTEYTESGPYKPKLMEAYHVIDPKLQNKSEKVAEAAVDFLRFLTAPQNLNTVILEKKGASIGAVMGTDIPSELNDWFDNSFPKLEMFRWMAPKTNEGTVRVSRLMEQWFNQSVNDAEFYSELDKIYRDDIERYVKDNGIDTSEWKRK